MKLQSFRIQNFKSVIDTGWKDLSTDNITTLIGQNEAGKTAILEALYFFEAHEGISFDKDALRSDGRNPRISCSFKTNIDEVTHILEGKEIPEKIIDLIKKDNRINLICSLDNMGNSTISLEDNRYLEAFADFEKNNEASNETSLNEQTESIAKTEPAKEFIKADEFANEIYLNTPYFSFFENDESLLPNQIDIDDLLDKNSTAHGKKGVLNLFKIAKLGRDDIEWFKNADSRLYHNKLRTINSLLTEKIQEVWSQKIANSKKLSIEIDLEFYAQGSEKSGKPYFSFWIKDGITGELLHPKQRSLGVRWFISFYLQLAASKISEDENLILLIDEPGANLHHKAQKDVLKVFEDICDKIQIIYTTHSPSLINIDKLWRLMPVERKDFNDEFSDTRVYDYHSFVSASTDTLSPLYTVMGIDFSNQAEIKKTKNLLLEEPSAHYYLSAFKLLINSDLIFYPLAATGVNNIQQLAYLLLGWGIEFSILLDDESSARSVYNAIKKDLYGDDEILAEQHMYKLKGCHGIEDIFTKEDFQRYVLNEQEIPENTKNSEYVKRKPKAAIALNFLNKLKFGEIKPENISAETKSNIANLFDKIKVLISNKSIT
jgi:ABC-type cobalamin/Fe3+-siderophores transport system ATPase subunit